MVRFLPGGWLMGSDEELRDLRWEYRDAEEDEGFCEECGDPLDTDDPDDTLCLPCQMARAELRRESHEER